MFTDLERIDPERLKRVSYIKRLTNVKAVQSKEERGVGTAVSVFTGWFRSPASTLFNISNTVENR